MKKELETILAERNQLVYNSCCGLEPLTDQKVLYYYVGKRSIDYLGDDLTDDTIVNVFFDIAEIDERGRINISDPHYGYVPIKFKFLKAGTAPLDIKRLADYYRKSIDSNVA
ncbi:hypothetical protein [Sphingobacterium sp. LRF_L2]|uniref:hypothetical protein n=1 Tax=Sphingobacterium sp. LRF_L2 TaxID=3369421 RepID=UPI003F617F68